MVLPEITLRPSVSQSLVKELRHNDVCPRRVGGVYVMGMPTVPNENQLRGIFFEYWLTGSCGKSGIPPVEPLQRTGRRYVDFERLEQQAAFFRDELMPHYKIEVLDTDVVVATEFVHPDTEEVITVKCRMDMVARVDGKLAVIDIKATGDVANGGWRNPMNLDHTQAHFYTWALYQSQSINPEAVMPDFYYIVADWSPRMDYEVIKVEWSNSSFWEVRQAATEAYEKLKKMEADNFPTRPSYAQCQQCPFQESCPDRRQFKDVKVIW